MTKINPPVGGKKIIVIVGPTASGKSDLAIKIAKKIYARGGPASDWQRAEIISADSRQVYRGMDIGTGKVPKDSSRNFQFSIFNFQSNPKFKIPNNEYYSDGIRHHLIDVANPKKQFTADDFKKLGQKAIKDILNRDKIPIVVGGTGFYIDVLLDRIPIAQVPPNQKLRKKLGNLEIEKLFEMLKELDPRRAKEIDRKNKRRLIRALEIAVTIKKSPKPTLTSKNATAQNEVNYISYNLFTRIKSKQACSLLLTHNYKILWIGIRPPQKDLEKRIKKRLDKRLKQGMIKEIETLHKQGVSWKRLDDFGLEYRQISFWLRNQKLNIKNQNDKSKLKNFRETEYYDKLLREIIKYSKRQMTWFKRNPEIRWINPSADGQKEAEKLLVQFLR